MSEWISVKDRLPEPGTEKRYLCYGKQVFGDGPDWFAAKFLEGLSGWSIPGISGLTITHWMSMPEPPPEALR